MLPKSFVFTINHMNQPLEAYDRILDRMRVWQVWLILGAIFLIGYLFIRNSRNQNSAYALKLKTIGEGTFVFGVVLVIFCISFSTNVIKPTKFNQAFHRPYDENSIFLINLDSNILIKQDKSDYPGIINDKKGYPYRFYVADIENINNSPTYLGHVKNGKIYLNKKNKAGKLFSKYYYYIKKHHLVKKFKHGFEFKYNPKINSSTLTGSRVTLGAKLTKHKKIKIYNAGVAEARKRIHDMHETNKYRMREYERNRNIPPKEKKRMEEQIRQEEQKQKDVLKKFNK